MTEKLDNLLKFRDNDKFKKFSKVFSIFVVICAFAALVLVIVLGGGKTAKDKTRPYVFALIPLIFAASFCRKNDYLFLLAEFVTIIADIFMILLGKVVPGSAIYFLVQIIYGAYFYFRDENKKRSLIILISRVAAMLICIFVLLIINKLNAKYSLMTIYGANLIINIIYACIFKDPILIVGFSVFAVSDIFIALGGVSFIDKILGSFNAVYFLYIISQVVLLFNTHNNVYSKETFYK